MIRRLIRLSVLAMALAVGCSNPKQVATVRDERSEAAPPRIAVRETERDLGDVPVNGEQPLLTTFQFSNAGGSPLKITGIEESCLCAVAAVDPPIILPGGEGRVTLRLKRDVPAPHAADITLHTNDPGSKPVKLKLKWRAVAPVEFKPYSLDFGSLLPGHAAERNALVVVRAGEEGSSSYDLQQVECYPPTAVLARWTEEVPESLARGDSRELRVTLNPGQEVGEHHGKVVLRSQNLRMQDLTLPVQWTIRDLVEASPALLYVGSGRRSESLVKNLTVSATGNGDLEVAEVRLDPPDPQISATVAKSSRSAVVIRVATEFKGEPGAKSWQLTVTCKRPIARSLNIPISAFVLD